jgi:hypothetical protein
MRPHGKTWLLVLILSVLLGYVVSIPINRTYRYNYVQRTLNAIPVPKGSVLFPPHQRYYDPVAFCGPLAVMATNVFVTDRSYEEVLAFYRHYLQTSDWKPESLVMDVMSAHWSTDSHLRLVILVLPDVNVAPDDIAVLGPDARGKKSSFGINVDYTYTPLPARLLHYKCPEVGEND